MIEGTSALPPDIAANLAGSAPSNDAPALNPTPATPPTVPDLTAAPVTTGAGVLSGVSPQPVAGTTPAAPQTFAQKMARVADQIGIPSNEPGGWAKSLVGAAQTALAGVGDIGKVPAGGGALYGVGKVLQYNQQQKQAQQEMAAKQKQQEFENKLATNQDDREAQRDKILNSYTNAQTVHEQMLLHQLGQREVDKAIDAGKANIKLATQGDNAIPAFLTGQTSDDLKRQLQQGQISGNLQGDTLRSDRYVAYPDGKIETGKDADGQPQYTTTYSVLDAGAPVTLDAATAKKWNDAFPGQKFTEGTVVNGPLFHFNAQQVSNYQAQTAARDKALLDSKIATQEDVDKLGSMNLPPEWNNALAHANGNEHRALTAISKNPDIQKKYPELAKNVIEAYGGNKEWSDLGVKRDELSEKIAKDAQDKKDAAGQEANPAGISLTPDIAAKISQLPKPQQDLLSHYPSNLQAQLYATAFGHDDGYRVFPQRLTKGGVGLTQADAFGIAHQLNPNFDPAKAPTYQKTRNTFASAAVADSIGNLNSAFGHIADAYDANNFYSTTPGVAYVNKKLGGTANDLATALDNAVSEVSNAYAKNGKATEQDIKSRKETMIGTTPAEQKAKLMGAAKGLISKVNALQHQWEEGSVPGSAPPINILSEESIDNIRRIDPQLLNEIQQPRSPQSNAPSDLNPSTQPAIAAGRAALQAPAGATTVYHDPKTGAVAGYAVNGKFVPATQTGAQ